MSRHDIDSGGDIVIARIVSPSGFCIREITGQPGQPLTLHPRDAGRRFALLGGVIAEIDICPDGGHPIDAHPIPDVAADIPDVAADGDDVADARALLLAETDARLTAEPTLTLDDVRRVLDGLTREIDSGQLGRTLADRIAAASA